MHLKGKVFVAQIKQTYLNRQAVPMVSVYTAQELLCLSQIEVDQKENEI